MNVKIQFAVGIVLIALLAGCGKNSSVTGKVTFPDGSPLTVGEVVFETSTSTSTGKIQKDGTYTMSTGELKGMPRGTYRVSIAGFKPTIVTAPPPELPADGSAPKGPIRMGRPQVIMPEIPVDKKFLSPTTSGLTCEVKGRTKYDITVEAPAK